MITLVQRVNHAKVIVEQAIVGQISVGLLLYIGFENGDEIEDITWAVKKIANLRMFPDEEGKMNKSLLEVNGEVLAISNFTLPANLTDSGRRPSFSKSECPEKAVNLYSDFIEEFKRLSVKTEAGIFGAMMQVESAADGPVNFILKR